MMLGGRRRRSGSCGEDIRLPRDENENITGVSVSLLNKIRGWTLEKSGFDARHCPSCGSTQPLYYAMHTRVISME
jgi:hypothetical protein